MKLLIGILAMLLPVFSPAQVANLKPLTIGDTMPDVVFNHVMNYGTAHSKLSDFKDKLVILDFWATWCSACIREFPKLEALQTHYKNKLQVLLLSTAGSDNLTRIRQFFAKHLSASGTPYPFPVVVNDTTLIKLFPHISIPHMVWLYNGKVMAITGSGEITAANIGKVLQHQTVSFYTKEDVMDYDPSKPLLDNSNGGNVSALLRRCLFTGYLKGMNCSVGLTINADSTLERFYVINQPVLKLYAVATPSLPANRILLENLDTENLIHAGDDEEWERANYYSYELTLPARVPLSALNTAMRRDLDRQFDIYSRVEDRSVACYALIKATGGNKAAKENIVTNSDAGNGEKAWQFQTVPALLDALNYQVPCKPLHPIVLDETGITGALNIIINTRDIQDLSAVKRALHPYGLDIIKVIRSIPMLVLSGTAIPPATANINSQKN